MYVYRRTELHHTKGCVVWGCGAGTKTTTTSPLLFGSWAWHYYITRKGRLAMSYKLTTS